MEPGHTCIDPKWPVKMCSPILPFHLFLEKCVHFIISVFDECYMNKLYYHHHFINDE